MSPNSSYFICTLPRSGSWLLAELLERTRIAGRPREHFEPKLFKNTMQYGPGLLDNIFIKGMTRNGVFGAKLHWYQFESAPSLIASDNEVSEVPLAILLAKRFPNLRYIWLTRRDKVRQAISYYRASVTGQWWTIPGVQAEQSDEMPVPYNFDRIRYLEHVLVLHESRWQKYFDENHLDPLVLVYEELANDQKAAVNAALAYVGLQMPKRMNIQTRLLRQSDSLTEKWFYRYTREKRGRKGYVSRNGCR